MGATSPLVQERPRASFDVICAGTPLWRVAQFPERLARTGLRFRSGIVHIARLLARTGIRVGLATVLEDDVLGRTWLQRAAALGIDVGGVSLASPVMSLVVVDAAGDQSVVLSERDKETELDVPSEWSSQVLLLSGVSPVTSTAAALCKAARKARREGTSAVLDLTASWRLWAGRDPRTVAMVLREVDVVRCSYADLAVLGGRRRERPKGDAAERDARDQRRQRGNGGRPVWRGRVLAPRERWAANSERGRFVHRRHLRRVGTALDARGKRRRTLAPRPSSMGRSRAPSSTLRRMPWVKVPPEHHPSSTPRFPTIRESRRWRCSRAWPHA